MQRISDLIVICLLFIPISFVLLVIAILILIFDGPPLLFLHHRIGQNGSKFLTYKFKTYKPVQEKNDYIIVDHERAENTVTRLGRVMRDHGWDELPQLLNILMGQMTFVGPRPLVDFTYEDLKARYPDQVATIESWKTERLRFVPGLSGWHQIHIDDPEVIKYEMDYMKNPSFKKKMKILVVSAMILILGKSRYFGRKLPTSNQYVIGS